MIKKQKLELTWIGKENRPRLEPRILLEDPQKSYHAPQRVTAADIFDNRLIFGDNLLALKALEQEFTGKIRCIFIDPPYNTGSAFTHYDDGVEHSLWLSLMRERLEIIYRLLSDDGSLWITIDDNEAAAQALSRPGTCYRPNWRRKRAARPGCGRLKPCFPRPEREGVRDSAPGRATAFAGRFCLCGV